MHAMVSEVLSLFLVICCCSLSNEAASSETFRVVLDTSTCEGLDCQRRHLCADVLNSPASAAADSAAVTRVTSVRSRLDCVRRCHKQRDNRNCFGVNHRLSDGACEIFHCQPTNYSTSQPDCQFFVSVCFENYYRKLLPVFSLTLSMLLTIIALLCDK